MILVISIVHFLYNKILIVPSHVFDSRSVHESCKSKRSLELLFLVDLVLVFFVPMNSSSDGLHEMLICPLDLPPWVTGGGILDAQKDMAMAGLGSIITILLVLVINIMLNKKWWKEMKESLSIENEDRPLGEIKLIEFLSKKK